MVHPFGDPNILTYLALWGWIPLSLLIFATTKPLKAAFIVYIGAILFLPEQIEYDLPLLPPIGKGEIGALCCLVGVLWRVPRRDRAGSLPRNVRLVLLMLALGAALTAYLNPEELSFGKLILPGHGQTEIVGQGVRALLNIGLPVYLGFVLIRGREELVALMRAFVVAGLVYLPLLLFEMRFSPQLNNIVYGYHQHFFNQTVRFGGFRPMVFMTHGLAVAMFVLASAIAAVALTKVKLRVAPVPTRWIALAMVLMLVLCRSAGALALGLVVLPVLWVTRPRRQTMLLGVMSAIVVAYLVAKITDVFPDEKLISAAAALVNQERADSLAFRFENDLLLVERAKERLWFGWGSYGRGRVYDNEGNDISVTDGYWVIELGVHGLVGLGGAFGVLLLPLWAARKRIRRLRDRQDQVLMAALAMMLLVFTVDLLPNGLYNTFPFFLAGALSGLTRRLGAEPAVPVATPMGVPWPQQAQVIRTA